MASVLAPAAQATAPTSLTQSVHRPPASQRPPSQRRPAATGPRPGRPRASAPLPSACTHRSGSLIHLHVTRCTSIPVRLILLTPDSDAQAPVLAPPLSSRRTSKANSPPPTAARTSANSSTACRLLRGKNEASVEPSLSFLPCPSNPSGNPTCPAFKRATQPFPNHGHVTSDRLFPECLQ
ncbi:unnamed protein product [Rangifer tarandus platyrhynchus]|uniref:Uncharacterized protein n=2 Tax=Rangifer tarandus platyrhynchus TaxID=3082113 RepID=A0ACB0FMM6_RANTA|nr:unnamed protein product [Rangifer tarandus platyrhynchus]CAI9714334.1 unnamed protein product [Rangifer tarandus platyrhynchus]